jgi:hypothetical protein
MGLSGTSALGRAALAGVLVVALAGCGSVTEAAGLVVDPTGQPVHRALVLLRLSGRPPRDASYAERTDSAGRFHAIVHGGFFPPGAVLSICAPGFAPVELRVAGGAQVAGLSVGLRPGRGEGELCTVPPGLAVIE